MANYPSLAVCGVEGQVCDLAGQSHTISPLATHISSVVARSEIPDWQTEMMDADC